MDASMDVTPAALRLPGVLDLKAAAPLAGELLALRGQDITLFGTDVERVGGQCLQVLLSARATWAADGATLKLADASPEFIGALALLGASDLVSQPLDPEQIS